MIRSKSRIIHFNLPTEYQILLRVSRRNKLSEYVLDRHLVVPSVLHHDRHAQHELLGSSVRATRALSPLPPVDATTRTMIDDNFLGIAIIIWRDGILSMDDRDG